MDPVTAMVIMGAISGAASLGGAGISAFGAEQANAQSLANVGPATTASIDAKMAAAQKYGISPLVMLGQQPVNVPAQNAFADFAGAGQELSRSAQALASRDTKIEGLKAANLELQNQSLQNDVIAGQLKNSAAARTLASAGSPPTSGFVPLPRPSPFTENTLPLYQDFRDRAGGRITLLTPEASQSVMNAASLPVAPAVGAGLVGANVGNFWSAVRPDVGRAIENWNAPAYEYYSQ